MNTNRFGTLMAWSLLACLALAGILLWGPGSGRAAQVADPSGAEDIEAGQRALKRAPSLPWYDYQQDSIKQVRVKPPRESAANRHSKWEFRERKSSRDWSWLKTLLEAAYDILFWSILVVLFVVIVVVLVYFVLKAEAARKERPQALSEEELAAIDRGRMENLPFPVRRPRTNLLDEARRHYEAGNVREAIIYYYSFLLVELDKHQVIHLTRGKTNRQYLGEARGHAGLARILEPAMVMFEDVFFGDLPLTRQRFEESWGHLERFQQLVGRTGA